MTTAVAVIIWILLCIIAGLSMLLLFAVFGVSKAIKQQVAEQKATNSLLREIVQTCIDPDRKTSFQQNSGPFI